MQGVGSVKPTLLTLLFPKIKMFSSVTFGDGSAGLPRKFS